MKRVIIYEFELDRAWYFGRMCRSIKRGVIMIKRYPKYFDECDDLNQYMWQDEEPYDELNDTDYIMDSDGTFHYKYSDLEVENHE